MIEIHWESIGFSSKDGSDLESLTTNEKAPIEVEAHEELLDLRRPGRDGQDVEAQSELGLRPMIASMIGFADLTTSTFTEQSIE